MLGDVVARPPATTRKGMKFLGWHANAALTIPWNFHAGVVTCDTTLYAKWVSEATPTFIVTFDSRGGSLIDPREVLTGDVITPPDDPTRLHYAFDGWFADYQGAYRWSFTQKIYENTTLYAKWIVKTYQVAFSTGDGASTVSPQTVMAGDRATRPADPTKEGYAFAGWYTGADFSELWSFASGTVTGDLLLHAKWIGGDGDICTVAFNSNGGSPVGSQTTICGGAATRPKNPTRKSYTFTGWYADPTLTAIWNFPTGKVTCDTTLYARWVSSAMPTCTVAFNSNGGSRVDPQIVAVGETVVYPDEPTKENFLFAGWFANPELDLAWNFYADTVSRNVTLYAAWIENAVLTCAVNFNSSGGSDVEAQIVELGGVAKCPENPTRMYHDFDGWFMDDQGTYRWNFTQRIYENMTLYASWTLVPWTMDSIAVNGAVQAVTGDTIFYTVPCGDTAQTIEIVYSDSAANSHRLLIPASRPFKSDVVILQGRYTLRLEKKFEFDSIARAQLGRKLLIANKNPENNGGFHFLKAEWWCCAKGYRRQVGSNFYYASSSGGAIADTIYLRLLDAVANVWLESCAYYPPDASAATKERRIEVFPNPVASGRAIRLKEDFFADVSLEEQYEAFSLIDLQGKVRYTGKTAELMQGLIVPDIPAGLYYLMLEGKAGREAVQIAVMN